MQKIAVDTYNFPRMRKEGFVYVDKTAILHRLACGDFGKLFFLARPRRFGKSLAVSTLHALFDGKRDLFKGLAIEPLWDWTKKWPVIHLDMGSTQADSVERFCANLQELLVREASQNGIDIAQGETVAITFTRLIDTLVKKSADGKVVLLIDEYDKPLLNHLCEEGVNKYRDALKQFYSVVKTYEAKLRFAFLTGVSKFSKVSIFSDLNNLIDKSMDFDTATLFGYTHEEVKKYFPVALHDLAIAQGMTDEQAFDTIIRWYDGYKFEESAPLVINPVSLGYCFAKRKFTNYWSQTAVPTFLIDILKKHPLDFSRVNVSLDRLSFYEPANPDVTTLLFQTGYLTIKSAINEIDFQSFNLGFPNMEVEKSFLSVLAPAYSGREINWTDSVPFNVREALFEHDIERFVDILKAFFANIPYDMTDRQNEQMWQTIVYVILKAAGIGVRGEVKTNRGRIDMTAETPEYAYVIEFKLDRPAEEAIKQIREMNYAEKFISSGKKITLLGFTFSAEKRTIIDVKIEAL